MIFDFFYLLGKKDEMVESVDFQLKSNQENSSASRLVTGNELSNHLDTMSGNSYT